MAVGVASPNSLESGFLERSLLEKRLLKEICDQYGVRVKTVEFLINRYREYHRGEITKQTLNKRITEALDALAEEVL